MARLEGKIALVTGASRGIGAATAQLFAAEGATVLINHRDSAAGAEKVLASLAGLGHRIVQASITDAEALAAIAQSLSESEGRLDILVNNAAVSKVVQHSDLEALNDELIDRILTTNVRGVIGCIRAFRPMLETAEAPVVVNISSLAGTRAQGSNIAYAASKGALNNLTMSLGRALAPKIRVMGVAPGLVNTEFTKSWDPAVRQGVADRTPLGSIAQPEDIAKAVLAACTDLSHSVGQTVFVDGGFWLN
ncbi:MAG: SDR family oxidoreductase [Alphaproteobacteria bacterium]|jgi:3-oxoacyl-[acyl-carrier protein] reductase|nr:short-chain dehydrogenase [Rhodospirillaceae bacterium]MDP6403907.1 SDR family oxidoreductase [Alphaproteobacteria bacterium]MDP6623546.1 SDR family oxidoreductase [Alphaproteobacteria bacterium]|tara:strand:+ start:621 stop:1367 length:747 start_codon:yes stop_codon:yes gene_type:complete